MDSVQQPITGREHLGDLQSPRQALSQFYTAFNARDRGDVLHSGQGAWLSWRWQRRPHAHHTHQLLVPEKTSSRVALIVTLRLEGTNV
jgi:hypothetical protein